ncbi:MAG: hypothetical protein HYX57_11080 [Chloroflexi bacterium]|nr:hypothetical protein [Chloroflexota bacterium]
MMLVASALVATASAAGRGATTVRGTQSAAGTCRDGGYAMTGSLTGCWWVLTFESTSDPDKSHYRATGEELFEGCLGDVCGTFSTTYSFTAKTDGPWADGAPEIHGRCHHPVTGGTGGFAGVSGELSFRDIVDVSPPYYPYWGNLRLGGSVEGATLAAARTLSDGGTADAC